MCDVNFKCVLFVDSIGSAREKNRTWCIACACACLAALLTQYSNTLCHTVSLSSFTTTAVAFNALKCTVRMIVLLANALRYLHLIVR